MYDLKLEREGRLVGACEVTIAADPNLVQLDRLANDRDERWIEPSLTGGWNLTLSADCHFKNMKAGLRTFLGDLESRGLRSAERGMGSIREERRLTDLGLVRALQLGTDFPGSVYFSVDPMPGRSSGAVPETGDKLSEWLTAWINKPSEAHNVDKVVSPRVDEKHLFVFLLLPPFSLAPFEVVDVLFVDNGPLPTLQPDLPTGVTHVWAAGLWRSGKVFSWSKNEGWAKSEKSRI